MNKNKFLKTTAIAGMILFKSMKAKILFFIAVFFCGLTVNAQQDSSVLCLPKECEEIVQKISEALEYNFSRVSEYVHASDVVSKEGIDSVTRVAVLDFTNQNFTNQNSVLADILSGKKPQQDISANVQEMLDEVKSVTQKYAPRGLDQLATQLGKINQKAAKNLSDGEAMIVYATTGTGYYSAKYWFANTEKWKGLIEYAKTKKRQTK
jgi:hypothetical protein